jgi:hypothetical protein
MTTKSGVQPREPMDKASSPFDSGLGLSFSPKQAARILGIVIICLVMANVVARASRIVVSGQDMTPGNKLSDESSTFEDGTKLFDVDFERSIPTWYQTTTLFLCAIPLALIALAKYRQQDRYRYHWAGLAVLFVLLSIDEMNSIHEKAGSVLRSKLGLTGFLRNAWVILAAIFVVVFLVVYLDFIRHLPRHTLYLFVVAGCLYVGGALVFQMVGSYWNDKHGQENLVYLVQTTIEETLEMTGILVFLFALLRYIQTNVGPIQLRVEEKISAP